MIKCIALDPGFSNTKVAMDHINHFGYQVTSIQPSVLYPNHIEKAATGMLMTTGTHLVQFDGYKFDVGASDYSYVHTLTNLDYSTLMSPEHRALFYNALAYMLPSGGFNIHLLVVGLPVTLLQDEESAIQVVEGLYNLKGEHKFIIDSKSYYISIDWVKVLALPMGAYGNWLLGPNCQPIESRMNSDVAILDIGMNNLGLYVIKGDDVSPRYVGSSKMGVQRLLEKIAEPNQELDKVASLLQTHQIIPPSAILYGWLNEVMGSVGCTWSSLHHFSVVLPVGDGAALLGNLLRNELILREATVYWPEDPINANVIGLWKWARHVFRYE